MISDADWDNSPVLRQVIERELDNWGAWSRQGNAIRLGHRDHMPGSGPPARDPPYPVVVSAAEAAERVISSWCSATDRGRRAAFLLKLRYIERLPVEAIVVHYNRKFKAGRNEEEVADLCKQAERGFWMLTSG